MSRPLPFISIIIPCRNEEKFIAKCLDSVLAQTYPKEKIGVLVVDGESEDATRNIVKSYTQQYPFIRLIENHKKITATAMNIGIGQANGTIILRLDAHSIYASDYAEKCVLYLEKYEADNVGGIRKAMPAQNTETAKAIALTFSSFFGVGNAYYQTGTKNPRSVDTVFGGCYRKEIFKKIGLYNEKLVRSQDMELNIRLKRAGGKIILVPDIIIFYFPKPTFKEFLRHNIADGIWAILPLKYGAPLFKLRHLLPLFFVSGLIGGSALGIIFRPVLFLTLLVLGIYLLTSLSFSVQTAKRERRFLLVPFLILAFTTRHFGYGIGSLIGIVKLII